MSARTAAALTFVDTNVLVYAHDRSEGRRQPIAVELLDRLWRSRTGILSTQVLQEFYVVATRKLAPPMSRQAARQTVISYAEWPVVEIDGPLIVAASRLEEAHTLSFWDALIAESALRGGASRLVSEDLQSGRSLAGLSVVNPFDEQR